MGRDTEKAEAALHDQEQLLPKKELLIVFGIMSLELLVCFIDQNGIGVLLPDIARDLNASDTISWAGTSTLIANTVFQVLYGRLSDLFGRKNILISALVLLSLSDLACGLSVNSTMLYIFRGLAGVANGGITSLTMMIVSDIVTLQERGKYQGILGAMVGLGNALGPLIAIFRKPSVAAMLAQSFLLGACYYSYLYFIPLYYQNVRDRTPLIAACLQLPLVFAQSSFSTMSGLYMSRFNRYGEIIWGGFGIWTVGAGLLTLADEHIHIGLICFFLVLVGFGTGMVFQPTLVALQAHCPKAQRAVIVSNRNFLRSSGGAVGLAVSSAILGNVLKGALPQRLHYVAQSTFAAPDLSTFSTADQTAIKSAYASASRAVFIWCVPCVGVCFLLCSLIKDGGLQRKEEKEAALQQTKEEKTPRHSVGDEEKCPSAEEPVETDARSKDPGVNVSHSANSTDVSPKPSALSLKSESSR
ncbi:hypothetical protein D0868_06990 [Hortaea werneckii]|uniref:Major facilitator superfamily (MFS) profile domain-containing protein n=1 Tax=Hortaea werneckii TaxID=91943 RepID=A0A3M7ACN9_HORWE|nr:hypothetical protein D0868_06990 [Hortaea werneckii]RMY25257.1 hypothetical protein D0866_11163 [Hortaea werneckii]